MRVSHSILTCGLALWLAMFSIVWCCCMGKAHAAASAGTMLKLAAADLAPDTSCCAMTGGAPGPASPASPDHAPASDDPCDCGVKMLDAPSRSTPATLIHAPPAELPVFHLALVTFNWLTPLPLSADHAPSPPVPVDAATGRSLIALACQLTI